MKSTPQIILVTRSETRKALYREAIELRGVACQAVSELRNVSPLASSSPFSGILLDMPVITKSSLHEKGLIDDVIQALPTAYINIAPATDTIKLLMSNLNHGEAHSLEEFLQICKQLKPRCVRPNDRVPLHLNALLTHENREFATEQTVTLNVSEDGCFLFSTNPCNEPGQKVTIDFVGLNDRTIVRGIINWARHWGEVHHMPGIGVTFESLTESQSLQLANLIKSARPK